MERGRRRRRPYGAPSRVAEGLVTLSFRGDAHEVRWQRRRAGLGLHPTERRAACRRGARNTLDLSWWHARMSGSGCGCVCVFASVCVSARGVGWGESPDRPIGGHTRDRTTTHSLQGAHLVQRHLPGHLPRICLKSHPVSGRPLRCSAPAQAGGALTTARDDGRGGSSGIGRSSPAPRSSARGGGGGGGALGSCGLPLPAPVGGSAHASAATRR
jgi:hypothetical protein